MNTASKVHGTELSCEDIEELSDKHIWAGVCRAELDDPEPLCPRAHVGVPQELVHHLPDALHADRGVSLPLEQARFAQGEEHPQLMAAPALTAAQFLVSALLGRAWCQGMLFFCLVLYLTPL